jgi:predicted component of type VI protein secretion system
MTRRAKRPNWKMTKRTDRIRSWVVEQMRSGPITEEIAEAMSRRARSEIGIDVARATILVHADLVNLALTRAATASAKSIGGAH